MIPRSRTSAVDSTTATRPVTWRSLALAAAVALALPVAALAATRPVLTGAFAAGVLLSVLGRPVVEAARRVARPSEPPAARERPDRA